jgi:hypothetical protein
LSEQCQLWRYVPVVRHRQGFSFRKALVTRTWLYMIVQSVANSNKLVGYIIKVSSTEFFCDIVKVVIIQKII